MDRSIKPAAKIGAALFALWGILHVWVGFAGVQGYGLGTVEQWNLVIGGRAMPRAAFEHATDPATLFAQGNFILNFCLDVAGYGVLGLLVAAMIWLRGSWLWYGVGVVLIGIADLSFLFLLVTSGVIEANIPTVAGPVIWLIAVLVTPFGLPRGNRG